MSDQGPQHVTISTTPSVPPITGMVNTGPPPRRRSPWALVMALVLTIAVIGAGVFAVVKLRAEPGGAASPSAAVEQFFGAMSEQDVLGMLDVVLPGERTTFRQPLVDLVSELGRLGVLDEAADLSSVAGIDLRVDGLRTIEREVTDDIVNVDVRGVVIVSADVRDLPTGDLLADFTSDLDEEQAVIDEEGTRLDGLRVTTVRQGGRWYVSLFYSLAESARLNAGLEPVPAEAAVRPFGSSSPEEAVDRVLQAVETLDLESLIAVLNPNEASALQRYAPLFLDDAQSELDGLDLRWTIEETSYEVDRRGDLAVVVPTSLKVAGEAEGEAFSFEWEGDCVRVVIGGEREEFCSSEPISTNDQSGDSMFGDEFFGELDAEIRAVFEDVGAAFEDMGTVGIVTRRVGGSWYVSPIGTVIEGLLAAARALDRQELEGMIEGFTDLFDEVLDFEPLPDDSDVFMCFTSSDVEVVLDCVQLGITSGRFDLDTVPAELRFPQCGLAEPYVNGYWDYSDEEFIELVEAAHVCFFVLAFTGDIEVVEIPYEALEPDCFAGMNPYGLGDLREADRLFGEINACLLDS